MANVHGFGSSKNKNKKGDDQDELYIGGTDGRGLVLEFINSTLNICSFTQSIALNITRILIKHIHTHTSPKKIK